MAAMPVSAADTKNENSFSPRSSFIEQASYDAPSMTLTLTFKSGSQYKYLYVRPATWEAFQQAPDHSSFYAKNLKGSALSLPVKRAIVGKKASTPLHKYSEKRTLYAHGNIQAGLHHTLQRAGLIPEKLHRQLVTQG